MSSAKAQVNVKAQVPWPAQTHFLKYNLVLCK